jgi:hypothetical protein
MLTSEDDSSVLRRQIASRIRKAKSDNKTQILLLVTIIAIIIINIAPSDNLLKLIPFIILIHFGLSFKQSKF